MRKYRTEPIAPVHQLAYHPAQDRLIAVAVEPPQFRRVHVWLLASGQRVHAEHVPEHVAFFASSRKSDVFAFAVTTKTGFFTSRDDHEIIVRSFARGLQKKLIFPGGQDIASATLSDDGKTLALSRQVATSGSPRSQIEVYRLDMISRSHRLGSLITAVLGMDLNSDGRFLACVGVDGFTVWDLEVGESACARPIRDGSAVEIAPESPLLAVTEGEYVSIWDFARGTKKQSLIGHQAPVRCLALSPDGQTLASGGLDRTVRFWDFQSGVLRHTYDWQIGPIHAISFAPDGLTAAAGGESGEVVVWDVEA